MTVHPTLIVSPNLAEPADGVTELTTRSGSDTVNEAWKLVPKQRSRLSLYAGADRELVDAVGALRRDRNAIGRAAQQKALPDRAQRPPGPLSEMLAAFSVDVSIALLNVTST